MSSKELLTEILVRSSLGGRTGSSIRSILPGAPWSATFWLCLTASSCLPAPGAERRGSRVLCGERPAQDQYRAIATLWAGQVGSSERLCEKSGVNHGRWDGSVCLQGGQGCTTSKDPTENS